MVKDTALVHYISELEFERLLRHAIYEDNEWILGVITALKGKNYQSQIHSNRNSESSIARGMYWGQRISDNSMDYIPLDIFTIEKYQRNILIQISKLDMNDEEIAQICKVSEKTIKNIRESKINLSIKKLDNLYKRLKKRAKNKHDSLMNRVKYTCIFYDFNDFEISRIFGIELNEWYYILETNKIPLDLREKANNFVNY